MKVIFKEPGKLPEVIDVANTLEALQEKVNGHIETVTFATDACVVCNEEGRLKGLPHNCNFIGMDFVGPILIVGVAAEEFCGLPDIVLGALIAELSMATFT